MSLFKSLREKLAKKPSLDVQQEVVRGLVTAKIYEELERVGMTKSELAERLESTRANISAMLRGDRNFTIDKLTEIAYLFDKTPKIDFVAIGARHAPSIVVLDSGSLYVPNESAAFAGADNQFIPRKEKAGNG